MPKWVLLVAALVLLFSPAMDAQKASLGVIGVIVERVVPNKILYSPNEDARATVWVNNVGSQEVNGRLVAQEFQGIDDSREVASLPLTLAAGEAKRDISFSWNVGPEMYGREMRVRLCEDEGFHRSAQL